MVTNNHCYSDKTIEPVTVSDFFFNNSFILPMKKLQETKTSLKTNKKFDAVYLWIVEVCSQQDNRVG